MTCLRPTDPELEPKSLTFASTTNPRTVELRLLDGWFRDRFFSGFLVLSGENPNSPFSHRSSEQDPGHWLIYDEENLTVWSELQMG